MKTTKIIRTAVFITTFIAFITGCSSKEHKSEAPMDMEDGQTFKNEKMINSTDKNREESLQDSIKTSMFISSSAAKENKKDTTRKFIRTAEMKFRAKHVFASTIAIEDIVGHNNGFVTYTNLRSYVSYKNLVPVSRDSSLETIHYTTENEIVLRIPNTLLDTTLRQIAKHIDFLDYREIKATDVSLYLLSNSMKQKRLKKYETRLQGHIDSKGIKQDQVPQVEESLLNKDEKSDNSKIEDLQMNDEMSYSTVKLFIYEREKIKRELIENERNINAYEPSIGAKIIDSLRTGWEIMQMILLFIIKIWPLCILGVLAVYFFRKKHG